MSVHFHIRWNDKDLDWQSHPTREEAMVSATFLVRPNKTYEIEQFMDENCPQCKNLASRTLSRKGTTEQHAT